nr:MAG TPA: hypothetical protein [Caudoviricetes sp.]
MRAITCISVTCQGFFGKILWAWAVALPRRVVALMARRLSERLDLSRWVIMPAGWCLFVSGRLRACCVVLWR